MNLQFLRIFLVIMLVRVNAITFLENFDATKWQYVRINEVQLEKAAEMFSQMVPKPNWADHIPQGLDFEESVNYLMSLISIDFCHWGFDENTHEILQFYVEDEGKRIRGSMAMFFLAKKAYEQGTKLFDASSMKEMTADRFREYFMGVDVLGRPMEIPMLAERVRVLNEVGSILLERWNGSFLGILEAAGRRILHNGKGFVELLVQEFPRFRDEYIYRGEKIGIYKLAQLAVMALENTFPQDLQYSSFEDLEVLTLCADYQIPKGFYALGILEYDPILSEKIEKETWLPAGSLEEIEIRMATVYAGELLKKGINERLEEDGKAPITTIVFDNLLWSYSRQLGGKHHLTRTIMY